MHISSDLRLYASLIYMHPYVSQQKGNKNLWGDILPLTVNSKVRSQAIQDISISSLFCYFLSSQI